MFQSTRPRGARRRDGRDAVESSVSIHAPARGATTSQRIDPGRDRVSIHAPARGATVRCRQLGQLDSFNPRARAGRDARHGTVMRPSCFNPRARAGRDGHMAQSVMTEAVSIHAPARGATPSCVGRARPDGFNPRARAGRDPHVGVELGDDSSFNPRARAGRDRSGHCYRQTCRVSIHAPARGAT